MSNRFCGRVSEQALGSLVPGLDGHSRSEADDRVRRLIHKGSQPRIILLSLLALHHFGVQALYDHAVPAGGPHDNGRGQGIQNYTDSVGGFDCEELMGGREKQPPRRDSSEQRRRYAGRNAADQRRQENGQIVGREYDDVRPEQAKKLA